MKLFSVTRSLQVILFITLKDQDNNSACEIFLKIAIWKDFSKAIHLPFLSFENFELCNKYHEPRGLRPYTLKSTLCPQLLGNQIIHGVICYAT